MKMADVRVGMKLHDPSRPYLPILTVTKITERGFKYSHEKRLMKLGNPGGLPDYGTNSEGEHYCHDGECWYEPFSDSTGGQS
jgi:hypothetical protein